MAEITGTNSGETLNGTPDADSIYGLGGDDTLNGLGGNDTLDGGSGNDTMNGGLGDDIYFVDAAGDIVNENAGEGNDEIRTNRAVYSLAAMPDVENLTGLGTSQTLTGNAQGNIITAGAGNDLIDGAAGADTMIGGLGNDDYTVDDAGDLVVEAADQGIDIVRTNLASYSMTANVENLTGTSNAGQSLTGNELGNIILGASGADTLDGGDGNDTLNGGLGADTMIGGLGDDVFTVDDAGDTLVEDSGGGYDRAFVSIASYTLAANVEDMTGTSNAGQTLTGNDGDNIITGGTGADVFNGGAGNDTLHGGSNDILAGGTGNDTYTVPRFAVAFTIVENAGEGIDTILSSKATFSLVSLPNVENLTFVNADISDTGHLTGNDLDNVLTGSYTKQGDTLIGGLGADTMIGLDWGDRYYVDNPGDVVVEASNAAGIDTVFSSINYTLGANVENLTAYSDSGLTLTGNQFGNVIIGAAGGDTLDGGGAADKLQGLGGADIFAFTSALGFPNVDTIVDFVQGEDHIGLDDDIFAGVTATNLASVFVNGTSAQDADDRIIYDSATGQLFYDSDGNGAAQQVTFAVLQGSVLLSSIDFVILSDPAGQTITGTPGNDVLNGGAGDDTIDALGGNDTVDGRQGSDTMNGGPGDDQYFVDSAGDIVNESANEGYDVVYASVSYALAAGSSVEVLATINEAATTVIDLTGNELDNYVTGNAGNNIIDGGGGAGSDQLWGRGGDDSYYVDGNDAVVEYLSDGYDAVYARSSFVLGVGAYVEVLATIDEAATTAINLTGNELNNYITGNAGSNILDGGTGWDQLWGRGGDDSYYVDIKDQVIEYAGQGYDVVYARESYVLDAGASIEVLATIDNFATTSINLTGNELDNYVTGNAGSNTIDGGTGSDTLWGREGDDSYFAESNDVVLEYDGQGYDIIYARGNFTLGVGVSVEVLGTENNFATTSIALTGNELANLVSGNDGANNIDGGLGADSLHGRGGADSFVFSSALGGGNVDAILDFGDGADRILLDDAVFTGLGLGTLSAGAFRTGTSAQDSDDRIIYDSATGALYFDADGIGGAAQVQFAILSSAPVITASDFTVI